LLILSNVKSRLDFIKESVGVEGVLWEWFEYGWPKKSTDEWSNGFKYEFVGVCDLWHPYEKFISLESRVIFLLGLYGIESASGVGEKIELLSCDINLNLDSDMSLIFKYQIELFENSF
jgi:hypothetical protein